MQAVFCPFIHLRLPDGINRSKHFLCSEEGHNAYQIKRKEE